MYSYQELKPVLLDLINDGIVLCPFFAKENGESRLDPSIFELLDWESRDFSNLHWNQKLMVETFGDFLIPRRFPRTSLYETAASTAVHLCENKYGVLEVSEEIAREAFHMVTHFITKHGYGKFMGAIGIVGAYENYLALSYYGSVAEKDYLLGTKHRPWIDYSIEDELILSSQMNMTRVTVRDGKRWIELTKLGQSRFEELKIVLDEAGYLRQRARLLRVSQFSHLDDYENITDLLFPDALKNRREFLERCGLRPGMKVLELGCGPGPLTLEAGLADLMGPTGHVIATDPALGMIARARRKLESYNYQNVEFVQCSAEEIPFADDSFDAVIGCGFLHFTKIPIALREMKRVAKPNGIISTIYPLSFPVQIQFISEWFEPLLSIQTGKNKANKDMLPTADVVPAIFKDLAYDVEVDILLWKSFYNNPEKTVQFFVESVDVFENAMAQLPWQARYDMVESLIERGKGICNRYRDTDLIIDYPMQLIRGLAPQKSSPSNSKKDNNP